MILEIYIDGACSGNPGPAGIGVAIKKDDIVVKEISRYIGEGTNNIAEYSALICALKEALAMKADKVNIFTDSELVFKQVTGKYQIKNANLQNLCREALRLKKGIAEFSIAHIPREKNKIADKLATSSIKEMKT
ncbi:MAG: ribonuclease HI family protein [Candidatus Omnitrophica bacterium]|nr:ribonuclease HI family protein [Candidatus Omnitrophota bacterium]